MLNSYLSIFFLMSINGFPLLNYRVCVFVHGLQNEANSYGDKKFWLILLAQEILGIGDIRSLHGLSLVA